MLCVRRARAARVTSPLDTITHAPLNPPPAYQKRDVDVVLDGVAALSAELAWFRDKAAERGLELHDTGTCVRVWLCALTTRARPCTAAA